MSLYSGMGLVGGMYVLLDRWTCLNDDCDVSGGSLSMMVC